MSKANIYLILPETNPTTNWSESNANLQSEDGYRDFILNKITEIKSISIENYEGYFDNENLTNFFKHFDTLEELYPKVKTNLKLKIKDWENWRENPQQNTKRTYKIFKQVIVNHTLPEIAQRKGDNAQETYALLNNSALSIPENEIKVNISGRINIAIDNVKNTEELKTWFSKNRIPKRKFHIIPKHGENGRGNWQKASPLMCSKSKAQKLLNTAIGDDEKKLFNYDSNKDMFIVFWNENDPKNQYHGYHLSVDTSEISDEIKSLCREHQK